jgi:hypothetical protein
VHKVLSLFDVVIGWLDRMVVKKLGELVEVSKIGWYIWTGGATVKNFGLGGNRPS